MFNLFRRKNIERELKKLEDLEYLILNTGEPIELNDNEEIFIKSLLLEYKKINPDYRIGIKRMSNKSLDFSYGTYPIGKIKLWGRKTYMQRLFDSLNFDSINNKDIQEYLDNIHIWIDYIKYLRRAK